MNTSSLGARDATPSFQVSRWARERYDLDLSFFLPDGALKIESFYAARRFAQKINEKRNLLLFPEHAVHASELNALALIMGISGRIVDLYIDTVDEKLLVKAMSWLDQRFGRSVIDDALRAIVEDFVPSRSSATALPSDAGSAAEMAASYPRTFLLRKLILLWAQNENSAAHRLVELYDDARLEKETSYRRILMNLKEFFELQPHPAPFEKNLLDLLLLPAKENPFSLAEQLEFILRAWGPLLGEYLYLVLGALDLIREEEARLQGPGPSTPPFVPAYDGEPENYSPDSQWMPDLVLVAKNTYVWLDQLSVKYQRPITRLDEIPDEELDSLAHMGFTGLWLIGLWERSPASKKVKELCGDTEAASSAYSIYEYKVASALGGDEACDGLMQKAWSRGIRLAADLVPNHTGLDSRWMAEHPDWFLGLDYCPFPSYTFNGPNLSQDQRFQVYLEDHYYNRSDAAVVFKRVDTSTGNERFIYHGNDGTMMPWNDTAQLNYLHRDIPDAVIETILDVAHRFPIIRFDAAMTLTRKHFQRLWFPAPGEGGAIPSRAEHGMSKEQFQELLSFEFWRRVVDRVADEATDTLLLAEAFWLTESFFVRTLGMHRVYNSAFMNMLREEENAHYRKVVKDTLAFDPEILKRFVNFMNNPDEETAAVQFGTGDKYFGICVLLATMPGLPMFGHGQIEGLREKYGAEFLRPRWDESTDDLLAEHHRHLIAPLLRKRRLFSGVESFRFYDFVTPDGHIDENVFAYSNAYGDKKALVVYHNRWGHTKGTIQWSAPYSRKKPNGERDTQTCSLAQGMDFSGEAGVYSILRNHATSMEHIYENEKIRAKGLSLELGPYAVLVFVDHQEVRDHENLRYGELEMFLGGRGVPSIKEALYELRLLPIHGRFSELINGAFLEELLLACASGEQQPHIADLVRVRANLLLQEIIRYTHGSGDVDQIISPLAGLLQGALQRSWSHTKEELPGEGKNKYLAWSTFLGWLFLHRLGAVVLPEGYEELSRSWVDEWRLGTILASVMKELGADRETASRAVDLVKILIGHQDRFAGLGKNEFTPHATVQGLLGDHEVHDFLQVNRYGGTLWFNKECYEELIGWLLIIAEINLQAQADGKETRSRLAHIGSELLQAAPLADYRIDALLQLLDPASKRDAG